MLGAVIATGLVLVAVFEGSLWTVSFAIGFGSGVVLARVVRVQLAHRVPGHSFHRLSRGELLRELQLTERLLEVDDVNPVALGEDEPAHLRVPPARLVAEVDARRQERFEIGLIHVVRDPSG